MALLLLDFIPPLDFEGAEGWLAPGTGDLTVLKPRHSAFFATPLDMLLREIGGEKIVLVGLAADMCVHFMAVDAFMRGDAVGVPATAWPPQPHRRIGRCSTWRTRSNAARSRGRHPFDSVRRKKAGG
ncbi:hypothetical protein B2J88_25420 [Rhodococcus sp. SRB_17]|uniref:cysteine hydrolase family protein n=1 Tax=Acidovorax sp. SRB_24 TaxID=1962700 RepID=UPI00197FB5F3|nr:hypothetical protein [Acidovorax sp. SRB_24]NMM87658.1 hypothetical protein [Rhodococcus sp. SRB_17]